MNQAERYPTRAPVLPAGLGLEDTDSKTGQWPKARTVVSPLTCRVSHVQSRYGTFQRRTVKRCSSAIRSGSVPLWARIAGMTLLRMPMPRASTYP